MAKHCVTKSILFGIAVIAVVAVSIVFVFATKREFTLRKNQLIGSTKKFPVFYAADTDGTTTRIKKSVAPERYFAIVGVNGKTIEEAFNDIVRQKVEDELVKVKGNDANYNKKHRITDTELRERIEKRIDKEEIRARDIFKFENIIDLSKDYNSRFVRETTDAVFNCNINKVLHDENVALNRTDISFYDFLKTICKNKDGHDFVVNYEAKLFEFGRDSMVFESKIFEGYCCFKSSEGIKSHKIEIILNYGIEYNIENGSHNNAEYMLNVICDGVKVDFETLKDFYFHKTGKIL